MERHIEYEARFFIRNKMMLYPTKKLGKKKQVYAGHIVNPVYIQIIQPFLGWLFEKRIDETDKQSHIGINASIILFSAIYFEGLLEDILCSFIQNTFDYGRKQKSKSLSEIEKIVSFDLYLEAFRRIGLPLDDFLDNVSKEDLHKIFLFRHFIAHGQRDSYTLIMEEVKNERRLKGTVGSYYTELDKFLIKRKIIKHNPHPQGNDFSIIFSNQVADWVYKRVKETGLSLVRYIQFSNKLHRPSQDIHLKLAEDCLNKL